MGREQENGGDGSASSDGYVLMAGDWLKVETCTPDKPEVIGIADILGIAPAHAFGSLFLIWRWFDQHTTEGNASFVTKVTIDRLAGNAGFADAMARVGWLVCNDDGTVSVPHFDRHNGETAKQRALTAKRVAKSKAKSNGKNNDDGNAKVTGDALPREEKRREDIKPTTPISPSPKKRTRLPAATIPNQSHIDKAHELGLNLVVEIEAFRNHHAAKGSLMADWGAALHTWLGNAVKFGALKGKSNGSDLKHDRRKEFLGALTGDSQAARTVEGTARTVGSGNLQADEPSLRQPVPGSVA